MASFQWIFLIAGSKFLWDAISLLPRTYCLLYYNSNCAYHRSKGPLARYVKLRVSPALGMPGTFSLSPRVSDHDTCVTHVPRCMPGSLTSDFLWSQWRRTLPGIPAACTTLNFTYLVRGPWWCDVVCYAKLIEIITFKTLLRLIKCVLIAFMQDAVYIKP